MCVGLGLSWEPLEPSLSLGMESWSRAPGHHCASWGPWEKSQGRVFHQTFSPRGCLSSRIKVLEAVRLRLDLTQPIAMAGGLLARD